MNQELLCPEHEAARIAGVSLRTLLRFSEAGYLTLYTQADGSHKYERAQVEEIFGALASVAPAATEAGICHKASDEYKAPNEPTAATSAETCEDSTSNTAKTSTLSEDLRVANLSEEVNRLRNLLALQERILDSKDDEIADLRNQRTWLRERIEKLEEKSDRDQILLLSETQTIRSLIAYQESRKSTFRQLLEWTGLVRDSSSTSLPQLQSGDYNSKNASSTGSSRTIDVSKAANAG